MCSFYQTENALHIRGIQEISTVLDKSIQNLEARLLVTFPVSLRVSVPKSHGTETDRGDHDGCRRSKLAVSGEWRHDDSASLS
jgi:hypothetical protein